MALIKCEDCGRDVTRSAKVCPQCGAKVPKKTSFLTWIIGAFLLAVVISAIVSNKNTTAPAVAVSQDASLTPEQQGKNKPDNRKRDAQLQAAALALTLKHAAKDPTAFELTSLTVKPDDAACYEYRAKHTFGAIFSGEAVLSTAGKLYVKEHSVDLFAKTWNKECTVEGGDEIAEYLKTQGILN
jgi:hypothetical protein